MDKSTFLKSHVVQAFMQGVVVGREFHARELKRHRPIDFKFTVYFNPDHEASMQSYCNIKARVKGRGSDGRAEIYEAKFWRRPIGGPQIAAINLSDGDDSSAGSDKNSDDEAETSTVSGKSPANDAV